MPQVPARHLPATCPPPARHLPAIAVYAGIVASLRARRWQAGLPAIAVAACDFQALTSRRWQAGEAGGHPVGLISG